MALQRRSPLIALMAVASGCMVRPVIRPEIGPRSTPKLNAFWSTEPMPSRLPGLRRMRPMLAPRSIPLREPKSTLPCALNSVLDDSAVIGRPEAVARPGSTRGNAAPVPVGRLEPTPRPRLYPEPRYVAPTSLPTIRGGAPGELQRSPFGVADVPQDSTEFIQPWPVMFAWAWTWGPRSYWRPLERNGPASTACRASGWVASVRSSVFRASMRPSGARQSGTAPWAFWA